MDLKSKTKEQLISMLEEREEKIEQLEQDVDYWQHEYNDIYSEKEQLEADTKDIQIDNCINNLDNFIWKLKVDNLYTPELERFIEQYMKYYNN